MIATNTATAIDTSSGEYVSAYTALEKKVMDKAKAIGADFTIVRAGTLKVGGW